VQFHTSDEIYDHPGMPYQVYQEFVDATSMGAYYNRYIRGRYRWGLAKSFRHLGPKIRHIITHFARLDGVLAENTLSNNCEKIRLMRLAMFADVDRLQASGTLVLPK
jgi:hypothetical protein